MAARLQDKKSELIGQVIERLHDKLKEKQALVAEKFLRPYYRSVAPVDLLERDPLDLYGAALAHFRFGEQRNAGETKVRVYNPQVEQHGWQSTHTVVEVVHKDMPFLVDSVSMALNRMGLVIHLTIHPVIAVRRDARGTVEDLVEAERADGEATIESYMHFEIDRLSDPRRMAAIEDELRRVLGDVRAAVDDWQQMLGKVQLALDELERARAHIEGEDADEVEAFLKWIADNHFTFLGYGAYDLIESPEGDQLQRVPGSALGILRRQPTEAARSKSFSELPPEIRRRARSRSPLIITKANARSTVHRPVYLDYVGVKRFDQRGEVIGEHRFLGLFTSAAYNRNPREIPLLRDKVDRLMQRANLPKASHGRKALANILETYPRDELFQIADDDLYDVAQEILHLQERQRIRVFLRKDAFARFVSCLIYVPRERYTTFLRQRFQEILLEMLGGTEVDYQAQVSESVLARIQFIVRTPEGTPAEIDPLAIEQRLIDAARSWGDVLRDALIDAHGEEEGNRLYRTYADAFPPGYRDLVPARAAVPDIDRIDQLARGETDLAMSLYRALEEEEGLIHFKLVRAGEGIPLSDALPFLENMGLRVLQERPSEVTTDDGRTFWLHDFVMRPTSPSGIDPEKVRDNFQDAFGAIWRGEVENDGFNRLILLGGLSWRQVTLLRAYCKYLLQIGIPFSQAYMEQTLARNPGLAAKLARLFEIRFDPSADAGRAERLKDLEADFRAGLDDVANLDEDRILRRYLRLILATLRTNHFQPGADGAAHKGYLSFKIDPAAVPDMPLPRPAFEIFVYSPRMEGVHLRGGKVARGGIRWSDRREDFRTEILGLMKAQMVKNSVIVPVGAKGGFVVKRPPEGGDRAALQEEVIFCYRTLMRGLLDLTDNRVGDGITPPANVVRYDDDDPYLVVAADKGTATFSDIANEISIAYGHWLADAFASGGSAGYDHKGMGITARGAWESVKRHFLEMGKNCQEEPFTAIGIGDMSGDVFGNGMLLSGQTRLIAAFNHLHVFIDPDPDPALSFAERQRLFDLGRSTWDDYDRSRISEGGGVWPRSLKSIRLSEQARRALDIEASELSPPELIKQILLAPVELFWNGGIGTYVKSREERHAEAFDRANDPVRVDGCDLRCKIVGEGGNLGFTQRGRIEFAKKGGRINTDAIDNSAGVDCSDHEVNIKILLNKVVDQGDMTMKQRDKLLAEMTDEVADLVLRNNILQVQAISLAEKRQQEFLDAQSAFIRRMEASGRLNRQLELLPDDEELAERRQAGLGLTRPEIAVLVAYAKNALFADLLEGEVADEDYLLQDLIKYFPRPLRKRFREPIEQHRLRREIIATLLANSMVNRGLGEFVGEAVEQTGRPVGAIARAYVAARDSFALVPLLGQLELVAAEIGAGRQTELLGDARDALMRGTQWFLRNVGHPIDMERTVERFGPGIQTLIDRLDQVLGEDELKHYGESVDEYLGLGCDDAVSRRFVALPYLFPACDVVAVAEEVGTGVGTSARVYFAVDAALKLGRLREVIERAPCRSYWERHAYQGLLDDLFREQRRLTVQALADPEVHGAADVEQARARGDVERWLDRRVAGFGRWQRLLGEIESNGTTDLAVLSVAVRSLARLDGSARAAAA
ncbi:MAG TPA: NAD-glutamate dehydrogenase [Geminicoccaceae bacterium]